MLEGEINMKFLHIYLIFFLSMLCCFQAHGENTNVFDPQSIITQALYELPADLKKLKSEFPQLSEIDENAIIKNGEFSYEKGNPHFEYRKNKAGQWKKGFFDSEKNGCLISVEVEYPAKSEDFLREQPGSPLIKIKNGEFITIRVLVAAEDTELGKIFEEKVRKIISQRLRVIENNLGVSHNQL